MLSSKKIYLKRDFAVGIYQSLKTVSHVFVVMVFSTQLCELLPL
jgi:hypothetical protein